MTTRFHHASLSLCVVVVLQVKGRMGGEDADGDGKITNEEMSPTDIMMMIT